MLNPNCEKDLEDLNDLLTRYYNKNLQFIKIQHEKNTEIYQLGQLQLQGNDEIREYQSEISDMKRNIESFLYKLKTTSKCQ